MNAPSAALQRSDPAFCASLRQTEQALALLDLAQKELDRRDALFRDLRRENSRMERLLRAVKEQVELTGDLEGTTIQYDIEEYLRGIDGP
jgi:hypothetical protein